MDCELIETFQEPDTLIFPFKYKKCSYKNKNEKRSPYYKKDKLQYKGYFSLDVIFDNVTIQKNLN